MTIEELRTEANRLRMEKDYENALPLYQEIWDKEKSESNGYYLFQCLRNTKNFSVARELLKTLKKNYHSSKRIQNEELWLDYGEKIKNFVNPNLLSDAENILSRTDKNDRYTGTIFNKTVLKVVEFLINNKEYPTALHWLNKLDFTLLSNSPFKYKGTKYSSDRKVFFNRYALVLEKLGKHIEYLENCLLCLGFVGLKLNQFKKYIIENITYHDYYEDAIIKDIYFALYIKYFMEEISNRKKNAFTNIFNQKKITLISDLGNFEFCPVSFAIKETYDVTLDESWEKDELLGEKRYLFDRYNIYQKTKNIKDAFNDCTIFNNTIVIDDTVEKDFNEIFNSKLVINNFDNSSTKFYSNPTDTIRGNPDYVFESPTGQRFVVIEKFTRGTFKDISTAFNNDLIKLYGYIFELTTLNLEFGYLIYWNWGLDDVSDLNGNPIKMFSLRNYRIFKVEKTDENKNKLKATIDNVNNFKQTRKIEVDGDRISYPKKCLNCSVVNYCNHKTGKFDIINLPYDISTLQLKEDPTIIIDENLIKKTIEEKDDLPF